MTTTLEDLKQTLKDKQISIEEFNRAKLALSNKAKKQRFET